MKINGIPRIIVCTNKSLNILFIITICSSARTPRACNPQNMMRKLPKTSNF